MSRFSWKKGKEYDGLRRNVPTYELRYGGKELATAQETRDELWFWYGDNVNTSSRPAPLDDVKAEALAHFKAKASP